MRLKTDKTELINLKANIMKTLIAGTVFFILTCVWIETSTEKSPVALLYLAISLFLILKGYLKLMHDLVKKEQEEYEQERRTKSR